MSTPINFVGPSNQLRRKKADTQRTVNMFPSLIESGSGKSDKFLKSIPGLNVFSEGVTPPEPVSFCGVLCHFDTMDGGEVVSAIGPNFTRLGTAALGATGAVFGGSAGVCGDGTFYASGITCPNNTSWRAEGFITLTETQGQFFQLGNLPGQYVRLYKAALDTVASGTYPGIGFASQVLGYDPPIGTPFHVALQYVCDVDDPDYHRVYWFAEGERRGEIVGGGPYDYFQDSVFGDVTIGGPGVSCDEFRAKWHLTTAELYRETYTVPASPFLPADPP